ncbi:MAG: hypothetical protein II388_02040, partial [Clostridia bacterium]|nr:hypothetical protein [Clostridia bacterium]
EGHFGRKCPLLPSKTKVPPPLQGGAIKYTLNKLYFLHSLNWKLESGNWKVESGIAACKTF